MKKTLIALLLLVLLLAGSAPAYASRNSPPNNKLSLSCAFDRYVAPNYYVNVLTLQSGNSIPAQSLINAVNEDLIWQESGGDLVPASPEVGSVWECRVIGYFECSDPMSCGYIVELMVLVKEITP